MAKIKLSPLSIEVGSKIRAVFEREIRNAVGAKPKKVALLLSSGLDSTVVGLAAHALGHQVHAYTFGLQGKASIDTRYAQKTANLMGWKWTPVDLPSNPVALVRDWPMMYDELGCRRKPDFECCWPFLYVYPQIEEKFVLNGLHADAHFGLNRKSYKAGATTDKATFDRMRSGYFGPYHELGWKCLSETNRMSGAGQHLALQRHFGLTDVNPFLSRAMFDLMIRYSWEELNKPRQKHVVAGAYPQQVGIVGWRNHVNYQLATGGRIDEHFACVLRSPVNFRDRKRTVDMFGDWRRYPEDAYDAIRIIRRKYRNYTTMDGIGR